VTTVTDIEPDALTALCNEIELLRARLTLARVHHANLVAAVRASLAADADHEPDPLYYLRDELAPDERSWGAA
jgi:hypothetical protein